MILRRLLLINVLLFLTISRKETKRFLLSTFYILQIIIDITRFVLSQIELDYD